MEVFWYFAAALGAGIGTGLAGLSAATVMVPVLIVLCPSFAGETGAYQATAITLASDILGSAVSTATYIRHQNIDLKRGWLMLVCIVGMCTAGSYAAWRAGNVVLGGFTLFLTFGIGIRFLIRPEPSGRHAVGKGTRLDAKGVAVSLFFGLTIGFGTGFVGTGGGMMMLVVFTAFLGMELKTAVGTSTFIMTFTALIASLSHILIHPAIVMEKWKVLLLCMVVATVSSLVSAQFANRVKARTVGLVTGAVLTLLGAAMIFLNYRAFFLHSELVRQTARCFGRYLLYILSFAAALILLYFTCHIPRDVFRKMLHVPAFTSSIFTVLAAEDWKAAALTLLLFAALVYPILRVAEHWDRYADLLVEKHPGEIRQSLLLLFLSQSALVALTCGGLGRPDLQIAATAAWGFGDMSAALVGGRLGKHPIRLPGADHRKTWEGSAAMALVSFLACAVSLRLFSPVSLPAILWVSLPTALVSAYVEMVSHGGIDTLTVPLADTLTLILLSPAF